MSVLLARYGPQMSDEPEEVSPYAAVRLPHEPPSEVLSVRIHPSDLRVLEWRARLTDYPFRAWLRDVLEAEADAVREQYRLVGGEPPTTESVLGLFQPAPDVDPRNTHQHKKKSTQPRESPET